MIEIKYGIKDKVHNSEDYSGTYATRLKSFLKSICSISFPFLSLFYTEWFQMMHRLPCAEPEIDARKTDYLYIHRDEAVSDSAITIR